MKPRRSFLFLSGMCLGDASCFLDAGKWDVAIMMVGLSILAFITSHLHFPD